MTRRKQVSKLAAGPSSHHCGWLQTTDEDESSIIGQMKNMYVPSQKFIFPKTVRLNHLLYSDQCWKVINLQTEAWKFLHKPPKTVGRFHYFSTSKQDYRRYRRCCLLLQCCTKKISHETSLLIDGPKERCAKTSSCKDGRKDAVDSWICEGNMPSGRRVRIWFTTIDLGTRVFPMFQPAANDLCTFMDGLHGKHGLQEQAKEIVTDMPKTLR